MTYLDERIEESVYLGSPIPSAGVYNYSIWEYVEETGDETRIFLGNFYFDGSYGSQKFDITDIIRNRKETINSFIYPFTDTNKYRVNLLRKYRIKVHLNSGVKYNNWVYVAMIYRYPNIKNTLNNGYTYSKAAVSNSPVVYPLVQGLANNANELVLTPHYPLKRTGTYKFSQAFINGGNATSFNLMYSNRYFYDDTTYNFPSSARTTAISIKLSNIVDWNHFQQELCEDVNCYVQDGANDIQIATFDYCYKRYYLLWQDRYGGYQSQGFNDNAIYSENFEVTETQNYKNERVKSIIQVQPKWKINSGWISEDAYPYYESIYTSPFLRLYDTSEDMIYEVIVTDNSYTEKTYKNEKKMLNLSLELEGISKQNIIY